MLTSDYCSASYCANQDASYPISTLRHQRESVIANISLENVEIPSSVTVVLHQEEGVSVPADRHMPLSAVPRWKMLASHKQKVENQSFKISGNLTEAKRVRIDHEDV